jgi:hypothetical protein
VRGAYRDVHAGFSNFEAAEAVDHGDAMDGKLAVEVRGDLLNFGQSHGLVSLVLKVKGATVFGVVADESVKDDDGTIPIAANISSQSVPIYGFVNQRSYIGGGRGHGYTSASAYGRQEGNFIAGAKNGVPRGELLIAGRYQRRAILLKLGVTAGVVGKKGFDIGRWCKVHGFVGLASDVFQASEKQDLDADRLGNGRHETIVTCVSRWD